MSIHTSHPDIVKRLKRAAGHLSSVIDMLEGGRPCLEVAQQLQAVESAIANAKRVFVQDHIEHCLEDALERTSQSGQEAIQEFKAITKYL